MILRSYKLKIQFTWICINKTMLIYFHSWYSAWVYTTFSAISSVAVAYEIQVKYIDIQQAYWQGLYLAYSEGHLRSIFLQKFLFPLSFEINGIY